jgi:hypothetical protein
MKKTFSFFMAIAFMAPIIASAVPPPWTMNSAPFNYPTGVRYNKQTVPSRAILARKAGINKGIVTFQYSLPASAKGAKLSIYNISGACVESFDLTPAGNSVIWNTAKRKIAAGIYIAAMRYGSFENKIQISIVK